MAKTKTTTETTITTEIKEVKASFDDFDKIISKEFEDAIDISKVDTTVKTWYDSGVYAFNYICSKNIYGAYPKGRITGIDGLPSTGKSLMASVAMRDPQIDRIIIIESEGGGNSPELIKFAGVDPSKVRIMKASTFQSYSVDKKSGAIEEVPDNKMPKNKETDKFRYVEGAGMKIRRLAHAIQFNKIKGNFLIIMDSLGNMQSIRGLAGGFDMGKRGQDFTNFFKNFDNEFERAGLTFIFTNKLYQSMALNGPSHVQTGGESPIYNSSLYIRLSTTVETDDVTTTEMEAEKKQRQTALGSSLKTIKAKVIKSRFGTEMRNIPFLLDFSVGPVRLSGLFKLLYDFGVIKKKNASRYEIPEIWEDKSFMKKEFVSWVLKDEKETIAKFQVLLMHREEQIKEERSGIQASDIEEVEKKESGDDTVEDELFGLDATEMINQMAKDVEE